MKTAGKILLVIAAVLVAAGIALAGAALFSGKVTTGGTTDMNYEKNDHVFSSAMIEKVEIESESADIRFEKSTDGLIHVITEETADFKYEVTFDGNVLSVKLPDGQRWKSLFTFAFGRERTTLVLIPENVYTDIKSIATASASGDTVITAGIKTAANINVGCASGNVVLNECETGSIKVGCASGSLEINNSKISGDIDFGAASGGIDISNSEVSGKIKGGTSSGDYELKNVECGKIDASSASGSVELINVKVSEATVNTVSGSIRFTSLDCADIDLESTSGSIKGSICGKDEFIFDTDSTSGRINTPASALGASKKLKAETVSGNINITYAE